MASQFNGRVQWQALRDVSIDHWYIRDVLRDLW